jgi:hypothetical protein
MTDSAEGSCQGSSRSGPDSGPSSRLMGDTGSWFAEVAGFDLEGLVGRLSSEFPALGGEEIRAVVEAVSVSYWGARIGTYVAIFVERESREQLRADGIPRQRAVPRHDDQSMR